MQGIADPERAITRKKKNNHLGTNVGRVSISNRPSPSQPIIPTTTPVKMNVL